MRWDDEVLDQKRRRADPEADAVVAELFASGEVDAVNKLMTTLVINDGLPSDKFPPWCATIWRAPPPSR